MKRLPKDWNEINLGDVCEVKKGTSITKDKVTEGNIPVIAGGQQPAYYHNEANRTGETITVSGSGAYAGFVAYFKIPIFASDCSTIQAKNKEILTRYIYYLLKGQQKLIYDLQKGIAQPHVYPKDLAKIKIPLPSLPIQQKIVSILEKAEQAKEWRKEADKLTKEFLKSVFVEMFGNLNTNDKKFPVCHLSEVCEINPRKSELEEGYNKKVSFMAMADIGEEGQIYNVELREFDDVKVGFTYFKKDDVLFAKITPCMENGKGAIAKIPTEAGFGSTEFHVLRPIKDKTTSEWIYYLLSLKQVREEAEKKMTGSAGQKRVPTGFFDILKVPLPHLPLQQKFSSIVKETEAMKEQQKNSEEYLNNLFNALIQKAFKGELI